MSLLFADDNWNYPGPLHLMPPIDVNFSAWEGRSNGVNQGGTNINVVVGDGIEATYIYST